MLPLQGTSYQQAYSLDRDNQLRVVLEAAFSALVGSGVVAGGVVTPTVGFSAQIAAGTTFFTRGVSYTLATPRVITAPNPSATNYAWWSFTRNAASQAAVTNLDTWTFGVEYTTTNVPPSEEHFPLTNLVCDGSGVTSVVDPAGKYVGVLRVDESILRDGSRDFTGDQSMAGFRLTDLPDPEDDADAAPAGWVTDSIAAAISALSIPSLTGVIRANGSVDFGADQSMGGFHLTDVPDPTANDHAVNKQWVVALVGGGAPGTFLALAGGTMGGILDMGGHEVVNAAAPTTDEALVTRAYLTTALGSYVVTGFLPLAGGTLSGPLDMGTHQITHVSAPSADDHAANQGWTNTRVGTRLPLAGGTMTGPINMGGQAITGLPDPSDDADPATQGWVLELIRDGTGQEVPIGAWAEGVLGDAQIIVRAAIFQDTVVGSTTSLARTTAKALTAPTAEAEITIYRNVIGTGRSPVGTITFSAGDHDGVIDYPDEVTLNQGDLLELEGPATADATLAGVVITVVGVAA